MHVRLDSCFITRIVNAIDSAPRLLDRVRNEIRTRHYSIRTEQAYVNWIRQFILFHDKQHPGNLGKT